MGKYGGFCIVNTTKISLREWLDESFVDKYVLGRHMSLRELQCKCMLKCGKALWASGYSR